MIFKRVLMLAAQGKDPAVWLLLGDLYASGCDPLLKPKRSLSCMNRPCLPILLPAKIQI